MRHKNSTFKQQIKQNEMNLNIDEIINCSNKIEDIVSSYIWSKKRLQNFIITESKGQLMHWNAMYELIEKVDDLNSDWFYRDENGLFYNVTNQHLIKVQHKIELSMQK